MFKMSTYALGSMIEAEGDSKESPLPSPAAVLPREQHGIARTPTSIELDQLAWGKPLSGPSRPHSGNQSPTKSGEWEIGDERTQDPAEAVHMLQAWNSPSINKWRLLGICFFQLGNGMQDGVAGALIPYIEKQYDIGYAVVSTIFVTNAAGFILAAFVTNLLQNRIGRARAYALAAGIMVMGFIIIACLPPFGVVVASFLFLGFGEALNLALNNTFTANLVNGTTILGIIHGSYGLGGTIAPLIATSMVSRGIPWAHFYLVPLAVQLSAGTLTGWSFRGFGLEAANQLLERATSHASRAEKSALLKRAFRNRTTILGAFFIFLYQGAEVSISGWVISFLISYRHGDPYSVGYVTAGFWGGITVGRFVLSNPAQRVGERIATFVIVGGAAAFQLLVWLVPNVIGDAVAVSLVGLLLGPVYPCVMTVVSRLLARDIQMSSVSIISAMGSSGGAIFPFLTGLLSQKLGTVVLHPIAIICFVLMEITWAALPRVQKHTE